MNNTMNSVVFWFGLAGAIMLTQGYGVLPLLTLGVVSWIISAK